MKINGPQPLHDESNAIQRLILYGSFGFNATHRFSQPPARPSLPRSPLPLPHAPDSQRAPAVRTLATPHFFSIFSSLSPATPARAAPHRRPLPLAAPRTSTRRGSPAPTDAAPRAGWGGLRRPPLPLARTVAPPPAGRPLAPRPCAHASARPRSRHSRTLRRPDLVSKAPPPPGARALSLDREGQGRRIQGGDAPLPPRLPAQEPCCSPECEQPHAPHPSRRQPCAGPAGRGPLLAARPCAGTWCPATAVAALRLRARTAGHAPCSMRSFGTPAVVYTMWTGSTIKYFVVRDSHSCVFIFWAVGDMLLKLGSRCLRLVTGYQGDCGWLSTI
ncbi:atherin-like isoform X2 [Panicum virgatum]|uniref:atherin-like isoform X2 n=1 Tax=Panicum virgatum TaxID=38727 RepID=UPI0019D5BF6E|nr:atherin-like isoform X2 [Panicum virgatum]XP_039779162.1 atherin-like isoform X2 [Panicum virgatum]XP_039779163.1 atherin-like isoform X2 [Panicum virgatum]XP_039779164.1 atherin-like isoform X2 [Panicum virgatum]